MSGLYVKICGLMRVDQAEAVAALGIQAIGLIGVPQTPRFLLPEQMLAVTKALPASVDKVGVFSDLPPEPVAALAQQVGLTAVQLHGQETPEQCRALGSLLPGIKRIKALRIRAQADLERAFVYADVVDWLLIDAYHPHKAGGTGQTVDWALLRGFRFPKPWILSGGLKPENLAQALEHLDPDGIDASSGVELSPGNKDLPRVAQLLASLRRARGS